MVFDKGSCHVFNAGFKCLILWPLSLLSAIVIKLRVIVFVPTSHFQPPVSDKTIKMAKFIAKSRKGRFI